MTDSPPLADTTQATWLGLDKVTIAAFVAGTLNLIGGVAAVRGFLLDAGLRYFDLLGLQFDLPRGVFIPGDRRILDQGYIELLATTNKPALALAIALFCANGILLLSFIVFKHVVTEKTRNNVASSRWKTKTSVVALLFLYSAFAAVFLKVLNRIPDQGGHDGLCVALQYKKYLNELRCPTCKAFGLNRTIGLALFADEKTLFIATPTGGLVRTSLDSLKISKPKPSELNFKGRNYIIKPDDRKQCAPKCGGWRRLWSGASACPTSQAQPSAQQL